MRIFASEVMPATAQIMLLELTLDLENKTGVLVRTHLRYRASQLKYLVPRAC